MRMKIVLLIALGLFQLCFLNSCATGPKVTDLSVFPNSEIPIIGMPLTWEFKGGTVFIIPKEKIQIKRIEERKKTYYSGIRKGWNSDEYLNEIEVPLELLISYGSGSWSRSEMDEKTKIRIRNGRIGVVGTIDLRKSKSYYKGDNISINDAVLIHETMHDFNKKCPEQTSWHYELDKVNDYYIVRAPDEIEQMAEIYIWNTSLVFCSKTIK